MIHFNDRKNINQPVNANAIILQSPNNVDPRNKIVCVLVKICSDSRSANAITQ